MDASHSRRRNTRLGEDLEPCQHLSSEGENIIKKLHEKQTTKSCDLNDVLHAKTNFTKPVVIESILGKVSGTKTCQDFEIALKDEETPTSNALPESCSSKNYSSFGRNYMKEALSVKPNSLETKLLKFALSSNSLSVPQKESSCTNLPMDQVKILDRALSADPHSLALTLRRKRTQIAIRESQIEQKALPLPQGTSLWDMETPILPKKYSKVPKLCSPQNPKLFTIAHGKIVSLTVITKNLQFGRKTDEQIRQLERFKDYSRGKPSEKLYLKNLPKKISDNDLNALIALAEVESECEESTGISLCSGKMAGQAFVTYPSVGSATKVLEVLNGTLLKERPVIVTYGIIKTPKL